MTTESLDIVRRLVLEYKENPASAGVIRKCDGLLKDEFYSETFGETIQMYGIRI